VPRAASYYQLPATANDPRTMRQTVTGPQARRLSNIANGSLDGGRLTVLWGRLSLRRC